MNAAFSPRAPWVMLALFCAAALILFVMSAGRDLGWIADAAPAEPKVVEVRKVSMAIVHDGHATDGHTQTPRIRPTGRQAPAVSAMLLSHQFTPSDTGFEAVFQTDRPEPETHVFFMPSPPVWVLDLPGSWKNVSPRDVVMDHGPVARVVIGEHEDFLRIVFYYRDKQRLPPAERPVVHREHSGFTVIVSH
jgi:hypothetical protein